MIKLLFVAGSGIRRILIENRTISFLTNATGFQPIKIDLDKIDEHQEEIKKMNLDDETIKEISKLRTEEEIARDIKKDFQNEGWRMIGKIKLENIE